MRLEAPGASKPGSSPEPGLWSFRAPILRISSVNGFEHIEDREARLMMPAVRERQASEGTEKGRTEYKASGSVR